MPQYREGSGRQNTFGELLGLLYTRAGLTQEELAHRSGVTSAAVRNWLRGGSEGGHGISVGKLRRVIEVLLQAGAFMPGAEEAEARDLWRSAVRAAFDERWFRQLRRDAQEDEPKNPHEGQARVEAQAEDSVGVPASALSIFFFNMTTGLPDPKEFYGREQERFRLELQTHRRQSTSIVGPNKIGKTWLMDYLRLTAKDRLGKNFHVGYIDALAPSCMTVEGFTTLAARQFGIAPSSQYHQQGLTPLEQIVANLLDLKDVPVLCIDSFDAFATRTAFDEHFFGGLRALAQAGLCLVTTSKQQLVDIVVKGSPLSSLINVFDPIVLGPFSEREALNFATKKGAQAGFSADDCGYLLQYGRREEAWPPARLQLVGEMLERDKQWGEYHPGSAQYWQQFAERLEERYRGVFRQ